MNKHLLAAFLSGPAVALLLGSAWAEPSSAPVELIVRIEGVDPTRGGSLRCAVFGSADGFPMKPRQALATDVVPAQSPSPTCRLRLPDAGTHAVAVSHDQNGNEKVDKNLFGIPTEGWAVSNDVRPSLRGPRFSEAAFEAKAPTHALTVRMGY